MNKHNSHEYFLNQTHVQATIIHVITKTYENTFYYKNNSLLSKTYTCTVVRHFSTYLPMSLVLLFKVIFKKNNVNTVTDNNLAA